MSELAFNISGERFELPGEAVSWRVRRLKPGGRGAPEVVFGEDGAPLILDVSTSLADFRRLVGGAPGRYRLDAIDELSKACEGGAAYLQLDERDTAQAEVARAPAALSFDFMTKLVEANTEMASNIASRFAEVMDSAATLIRAADGAGLPQREPMAAPRNASEPVEADVAEEEGRSVVSDSIAEALRVATPLLGHVLHTKLLGLSPDQSKALLGVASAEAPAVEGSAGIEVAGSDDVGPETTGEFEAHLAAIEAELSPDEAALARQALAQMPESVLATYRAQILKLSPTQAAEMVRGQLGRLGGAR